MLLRGMTSIRGNENFEMRFEYSAVLKTYFSERTYKWIHLLYHFGNQLENVGNIIALSRILDAVFVALIGHSYGLQLYPIVGIYSYSTEQLDQYVYSKPYACVATLGYFLNLVVCLRLSLFDMGDNMRVQYFSLIFLVISLLQLSSVAIIRICLYYLPQASVLLSILNYNYPYHSIPINLPQPYGKYQFDHLFAVFISGYSYIVSIPSLANETTADVQIGKTVWKTALIGGTVYYIFGILLAAAFGSLEYDNIMEEILATPKIHLVTRVSVYIFTLLTVAPAIVTTNISTRYNLFNVGICTSPEQAFVLGCIGPYVLSLLLSGNSLVSDMLEFVGLLATLICNFVAPAIIYLIACQLEVENHLLCESIDNANSQRLLSCRSARYLNDFSRTHNQSKEILIDDRQLSCNSNANGNLIRKSASISNAGNPTNVNSSVREVQEALQDWLRNFVQTDPNSEIAQLLESCDRDNNDFHQLSTRQFTSNNLIYTPLMDSDYEIISNGNMIEPNNLENPVRTDIKKESYSSTTNLGNDISATLFSRNERKFISIKEQKIPSNFTQYNILEIDKSLEDEYVSNNEELKDVTNHNSRNKNKNFVKFNIDPLEIERNVEKNVDDHLIETKNKVYSSTRTAKRHFTCLKNHKLIKSGNKIENHVENVVRNQSESISDVPQKIDTKVHSDVDVEDNKSQDANDRFCNHTDSIDTSQVNGISCIKYMDIVSVNEITENKVSYSNPVKCQGDQIPDDKLYTPQDGIGYLGILDSSMSALRKKYVFSDDQVHLTAEKQRHTVDYSARGRPGNQRKFLSADRKSYDSCIQCASSNMETKPQRHSKIIIDKELKHEILDNATIQVYPKGMLRKYHVEATYVLLSLLICCLFTTLGLDIVFKLFNYNV